MQRRHGASARPGTSAAPPAVGDVLGSPGRALEPPVRGFMEMRFGRGFGHVRVHDDARAAASADALDARAFTDGRHLVFGRGEYAPETAEGKRLVAHELAHVVQRETGDASGRSGEASPAILRKERDEAPAISPDEPAASWFYADDPTGHVASIYFDTSSSQVDANDEAVLRQVVQLFADPSPPTSLTLEGYTDTVGDAASNLTLSTGRAQAAAAWLSAAAPQVAPTVKGLGEHGPEASAGEPALGHYRRVDVIIAPPRATTPRAPQGPGPFGRSKELKAELARAVSALDATLAALTAGVPSPDTVAALRRYFPHERYDSAEFTSVLTGEIAHLRNGIESSRYEEFHDQAKVDAHCDMEFRRGNPSRQKLCEALAAARHNRKSAFAYPLDNPDRIVLTPRWYKRPDPASVLVHESTHLLLGLRGHPTEVPHRDPYAIQGFVAALGGLKAPEPDSRYPAR